MIEIGQNFAATIVFSELQKNLTKSTTVPQICSHRYSRG